jgi:Holliday junction resolvase RusA-like endonuclease
VREITFDILGIPEALARPRAVRRGPHIGIYQPKPTWQGIVSLRAQEVSRSNNNLCFHGPVRLLAWFRMKRTSALPKTREVPHTRKPDLDNAIKSLLDGLVPALVVDDKRVVALEAEKRYCLPWEAPGCQVTIREMLMPEGAGRKKVKGG